MAPRANALILALLCCTVLPVLETRSSAPPDLPRSHSAFGALTGLAVSPGRTLVHAPVEGSEAAARVPDRVRVRAAPWSPLTSHAVLLANPGAANVATQRDDLAAIARLQTAAHVSSSRGGARGNQHGTLRGAGHLQLLLG